MELTVSPQALEELKALDIPEGRGVRIDAVIGGG